MKYLFTHGHIIVDPYREYMDGAILVEDERIIDVFPQSNKVKETEDVKIIDLKGSLVMPGNFDTHTHGIKGISFDTADREKMDEASLEMAKSGTTSFLSSISYDVSPDLFKERFSLFNTYEGKYARYEGIHMEGPYLSKKHLGIGNPEKFLMPDINVVKDILENTDKLRQMTIAYELDGAKDIGKLLKENNVKVMCGHSDAVLGDLDENVDGFTHLFNAMRGLHHRDITLVNCAFMNRWMCEIITDGNHIDRNVLKLVLNNIDRDKLMIVSDSSIARGLPDGEYFFMSRNCIKKGTSIITDDGHYAGSVVSINDEMKVLRELGTSYTDLLCYSSYNAFRFYGLDSQYGTIEKGKYADMVIMDDDLNIRNVYVKGNFIYEHVLY
ncbi:MAG: N-acetylglucosamine-6-phosphate deacetylase [Erysipelotrichaceae bacterium]|nr:N-acetylglucosamine-6-phosphate deacetylase [Erysipelotrichaceae bacterium]